MKNLEKENKELRDRVAWLTAQNYELSTRAEKLQWEVDGYVECACCDGSGGRYSPRGSSPMPDPQTWEDCPACKGEGWTQ